MTRPGVSNGTPPEVDERGATLPRYWVVIPAAGVGRRMGGAVPKQYLRLGERSVIEHTLACFNHQAELGTVSGIVVVTSAADRWWPSIDLSRLKVPILEAPGGAERFESVLNGIDCLDGHAHSEDWVLVHDAARPCLSRTDIDRLITRLGDHPVGGLLAVPVGDTLKRADDAGGVQETVPRSRLWRALTPQMFRLGRLRSALHAVRAAGLPVTDECEAIERYGSHSPHERPVLVEGSSANIKLTYPGDIEMAAAILLQQAQSVSQ